MVFINQLKVLMWKNITKKWRNPTLLAAEMLWPLVVFSVIVGIKLSVFPTETYKECNTPPRALPSAGNLAFLTSYICDFNNPCEEDATLTDVPGRITNFNDSLIASYIKQLQSWMEGLSDFTVTDVFRETVDVLYDPDSFTDVNNSTEPNMNATNEAKMSFVNNTEDLNDFIVNVQESLDSLNKTEIPQFLSNLFNGSSFLSKFSDTVCGKRRAILQEHRHGQGMSDTLTWIINVVLSQGTDHQRNVTDPDLAPECASLFESFEQDGYSSFLWHQLKPLAIGYINYTPDNAATRKIIAQAAGTFDILDNIYALVEDVKHVVQHLLRAHVDVKKTHALVVNRCRALLSNATLCNNVENLLQSVDDSHKFLKRVTDEITKLQTYTNCLRVQRFVGQPSVEAMFKESEEQRQYDRFWAAIVFDNIEYDALEVPKLVKYTIRLDPQHCKQTHILRDWLWTPGDKSSAMDSQDLVFGFSFIQDMIDHAIIRVHTNVIQEPGIYHQYFPFPSFKKDQFFEAIFFLLPLLMVVSWTFPVSMIVNGIVYEKEHHLKENLKIMGLGNGVNWFAWFINFLLPMTFTAILLCILLKEGQILKYSDPSLVFVFLFAFIICSICLALFVSVFFEKASLASVWSGVIFIATYLPDIAFTLRHEDETMTFGEKIAMCISPTMAMAKGLKLIGNFEIQGIGAQWPNFAMSPAHDDSFTLLVSIGMMLLDSFILILLALYIDSVFPGTHGIASSWVFFLHKSFWTIGESNLYFGRNISLYDHQQSISQYYGRRGSYEHHKMRSRVGVAVRDLTKLYKGADRPAIDKLSLNFYEGQITSFLGHNGAGKTTTLSILTGLLAPTKGTVFIDDLDIRTNIDKIRHNIGWCPQHNVLINYLTVEEHVWLFGQLRRRDGDDMVQDVDQLLQDIGLWDKRKCKIAELSGGMKRKLCVALAFVGGSTTVILDEPTAGVDPYSRRAIWELLLKFKAGRTIILSTHHMDEADVLGDRIAIISNGKLRAVGSSLFLKDRFGSGYYLTMQKKDKSMTPTSSVSSLQDSGADLSHEQTGSTNLDEIVNFVQGFVNNAILVENNDLQICFRIPDDTDHGTELVHILDALEESKDDLGIASYGISDTDLEEVFLKIAQPIVEDSNYKDELSSSFFKDHISLHSEGSESNLSINVSGMGSSKLGKTQLLLQQMMALFAKRFHNSKRNFRALATQILAPVVFLCLSSLVTFIISSSQSMPPLLLQPWHLEHDGHSLITFYSNDNRNNQIANQLENDLLHNPYYGTRCLNEDIYFIRGKPCLSLKDDNKSKLDEITKHVLGDCKDEKHCPLKFKASDKIPLLKKRLGVNDQLFNLTGQSVSKWLFTTESQYRMNRYGGFSFGVMNELGHLNPRDISSGVNLLISVLDIIEALPLSEERLRKDLSSAFQFLYNEDNIKVWINNNGVHAGTSYTNGVNNLLLRALLPQNETLDEYGIVTTSYPLRRNKEAAIRYIEAFSGGYLASAICILFAFSFVPASFVVFLVEERTSNSKHLQILCGIRPTVYWLMNWMWDMATFTIAVIICIVILLLFGKDEYISETSLPFFACLLMMYGWSVTPIMYLLSNFFKEPSSSFVVLSALNVFLGTLCTLGSYIPSMISLKKGPGHLEFNENLNQVLNFVPHFCLTKGILDLSLLDAEATLKSSFGESLVRDLMSWDWNGQGLVKMFFVGLVLNVLVLLLEEPWCLSLISRFRCNHSASGLVNLQEAGSEEEDMDVKRERQRVLSGEASNDMLRLEELTKVHNGLNSRPAVDRLCVGVPQAQCFGLLGVNGAGKSTTFQMLTGNLSVTSGDAFIAGYSVCSNITQVRQLIGYCPQADALDPLLTAREHLEFYAKARGMESANVKLVTIWAIKTLGLTAYADKPVQCYSGGNKRKLSIAIALIGSPPVIFLDEPTAGMDPVARRFVWNCINSVVKAGRTVILTSHSMEECEALCNRLAIMVNGRFKCLGSLQHLKNRFGSGYTITLRAGGMHPDLTSIRQFISSTLPSAVLVEQHNNMLQYQLGKNSLSLGKLFWSMEQAKALHGVEDYSVSQTTLEQVFMNFAKNQRKSNESPVAETEDGIPLSSIGTNNAIYTLPEVRTNGAANYHSRRSLSELQNDDDGVINLEMFKSLDDEETGLTICERL